MRRLGLPLTIRRPMAPTTRERRDFDDVFTVQVGYFVPTMRLRIGKLILDKGEPVLGNLRVGGVSLYSILGEEVELVRNDDDIPELKIPPSLRHLDEPG